MGEIIIFLMSDVTKEELAAKSISELKKFLVARDVDITGCFEKSDLVDLAFRSKDKPVKNQSTPSPTPAPANDDPPDYYTNSYNYPEDELPSANKGPSDEHKSPEIDFTKKNRPQGIPLGKGGKTGEPGKPLETELYDVLEVAPDAEPSQIKKAYYKKAMVWHPDKNSSPEAEEKFKAISEAYQVLMDPDSRAAYDKYGKQGLEEQPYVDPKVFFSMLFGGGRFEEFIGTLGISSMDIPQEGQPEKPPEEQPNFLNDPEKEERIEMLAEKLKERIEAWKENQDALKILAEELVDESFGMQLLGVIGYVYEKKAKTFIGKHKFLGVPGIISRVGDVGHLAKETCSFFWTGADATMSIRDYQNLENQEMSQEQRELLEQTLANKLLNIMWAVNKLDIEHVLRNACEKIFLDEAVPLEKRLESARAVQAMGALFQTVSKRKATAEKRREKQERDEKRKLEREKQKQEKLQTKKPKT